MYGISQQSCIIPHENTRIIVKKKIRGNATDKKTQSFNTSYVIYINYFTKLVVRLRNVVVTALASHARDRGFDPRCNRNNFFFFFFFFLFLFHPQNKLSVCTFQLFIGIFYYNNVISFTCIYRCLEYS